MRHSTHRHIDKTRRLAKYLVRIRKLPFLSFPRRRGSSKPLIFLDSRLRGNDDIVGKPAFPDAHYLGYYYVLLATEVKAVTHRLFLPLILAMLLAACSGVEVQPGKIDQFAAGNYQYYKWRTEPMSNTANSSDPIYNVDPVLRRQVNADLQSKGYILNEERAQFSVDYIFAAGMRQGEKSEQASNLTPYPRVMPNRQVDGASVDNAIALGGVKETRNIALQFNDVASNEEVWQVIMTRIVEDVNNVGSRVDANLSKAISQALKPLPHAH
ncbi:MAG: hypothetical protein DRQ98_00775 [Gammaproteobacteria bacterium]|nr:MAG: hypothetical protein DRQ98_00775 [Gammaproteobacteria bacterium]